MLVLMQTSSSSNKSRTEVLFIDSEAQREMIKAKLQTYSEKVKDLDVLLDCELCFESGIRAITKTVFII